MSSMTTRVAQSLLALAAVGIVKDEHALSQKGEISVDEAHAACREMLGLG